MKVFRTKSIHPNVKLHYNNFTSQKIKNFDYKGYFHLSERGRIAVLSFSIT